MDDIEALVRAARPVSGHRDRDLSERAERDLEAIMAPSRADRAPVGRGRRPRPRTRRIGVALVIAVIAVCAAVGVSTLLDRDAGGSRMIAQPAALEPSRVLSAAAENLADDEGAQSESATTMPDPGDGQAIVAWLTSGAGTRADHARWLGVLADDGAATSAERGTNGTWRISVAGIVLVIRADSGEIAAVVDSSGETRVIPPLK